MRGVICGETTVTSVAERSTASIFCSAMRPPPTISTLCPSSLRKIGYRDMAILPLRAAPCRVRDRAKRPAGLVRQEKYGVPFPNAEQKTAARTRHYSAPQDNNAAVVEWQLAPLARRTDNPQRGQNQRA